MTTPEAIVEVARLVCGAAVLIALFWGLSRT